MEMGLAVDSCTGEHRKYLKLTNVTDKPKKLKMMSLENIMMISQSNTTGNTGNDLFLETLPLPLINHS